MAIVFEVLLLVLWLFLLTLIARVVIDLLQVFARDFRPSGLVLVLFEVVFTVTDPPLGTAQVHPAGADRGSRLRPGHPRALHRDPGVDRRGQRVREPACEGVPRRQ